MSTVETAGTCTAILDELARAVSTMLIRVSPIGR